MSTQFNDWKQELLTQLEECLRVETSIEQKVILEEHIKKLRDERAQGWEGNEDADRPKDIA
jgi:hypothetical protein